MTQNITATSSQENNGFFSRIRNNYSQEDVLLSTFLASFVIGTMTLIGWSIGASIAYSNSNCDEEPNQTAVNKCSVAPSEEGDLGAMYGAISGAAFVSLFLIKLLIENIKEHNQQHTESPEATDSHNSITP